MKVVVEDKKDRVYPYLGKYSDEDSEYVVLFSRPNHGTIVAILRQDEDSNLTLGEVSTEDECFAEWAFSYFMGAIILSN